MHEQGMRRYESFLKFNVSYLECSAYRAYGDRCRHYVRGRWLFPGPGNTGHSDTLACGTEGCWSLITIKRRASTTYHVVAWRVHLLHTSFYSQPCSQNFKTLAVVLTNRPFPGFGLGTFNTSKSHMELWMGGHPLHWSEYRISRPFSQEKRNSLAVIIDMKALVITLGAFETWASHVYNHSKFGRLNYFFALDMLTKSWFLVRTWDCSLQFGQYFTIWIVSSLRFSSNDTT